MMMLRVDFERRGSHFFILRENNSTTLTFLNMEAAAGHIVATEGATLSLLEIGLDPFLAAISQPLYRYRKTHRLIIFQHRMSTGALSRLIKSPNATNRRAPIISPTISTATKMFLRHPKNFLPTQFVFRTHI
jgi:hypothetical protein